MKSMLTTILGLVAATLTTSALVPQVLQAWKSKQTKDISLHMYLILCVGVLLWLLYAILVKDLPLLLANIVSAVLVNTMLFLKFKHG